MKVTKFYIWQDAFFKVHNWGSGFQKKEKHKTMFKYTKKT